MPCNCDDCRALRKAEEQEQADFEAACEEMDTEPPERVMRMHRRIE